MTRAAMARTLGISKPTASQIASFLLERGFIIEQGVVGRGAVGRRGTMLTLDGAAVRFLGVRIDVSHCTVFCSNALAVLPEPCGTFATPTAYPAFLAALCSALAAVRSRLGVPPLACILSIPGMCNDATGEVFLCPNLHMLDTRSVRSDLASRLGIPVIQIQEVRALALGALEVHPVMKTFFCLDIAQGVGGASVIDNVLYHGRFHAAGEIGHTPVEGGERPCGCGRCGCLETIAGSAGLLRSAAERFGSTGPARTFEEYARSNPGKAEELFLDVIPPLARALAGAAAVLDPDHLVVHGAVWDLCPRALPLLRSLTGSTVPLIAVRGARRRGMVRHAFHESILLPLKEL